MFPSDSFPCLPTNIGGIKYLVFSVSEPMEEEIVYQYFVFVIYNQTYRCWSNNLNIMKKFI